MKLVLTNFSLKHPRLILLVAMLLLIFFGAQFPKVTFDNDPENMLAEDEHIRVVHNEVKDKYDLYDFVIVGIVNETHPAGVFNVRTLTRIHDLTAELLSLRKGEDGKPVVTRKTNSGTTDLVLDLAPKSGWDRALAAAFDQDPNRLFNEAGESAIINREIISPSVVDNIRQAEFGQLKLEYLMEQPPMTEAEARRIRDDAMSNPLYSGTLVAEDEKAICLYIPIEKKTYSYNVAMLVRELTKGWEGDDQVLITGQPVAQDTFGVEMLVQMATSAPLAGLAIFLLLLLFFRRMSLIMAPMIVAVVSVVCTMGLLIGLGFDVHIMSSMIAIFLMPIAVADSVHILSEFFDLYHRFQDKAKTIRHVIGHLFMPMLYTSLTTVAGFASLATTPIPPVRIFGLHVAFGVALAWVLTMTLIPAYIMLAVPKRTLAKLTKPVGHEKQKGPGLSRFLDGLGHLGYLRWRFIVLVTLVVLGVSVYGVTRIRVNDNPVKWFTTTHDIRVADRVLNDHFGGTYTAYLTFKAKRPEAKGCEEKAAKIRAGVLKRFEKQLPDATAMFLARLDAIAALYTNAETSDLNACFVKLANAAAAIDKQTIGSWENLAFAINDLNPEGLGFAAFRKQIGNAEDVVAADIESLLAALAPHRALMGEELMDAALKICDARTELSFKAFVYEIEPELTAPLFKQPKVLAYVQQLQERLLAGGVVGKTSSVVDALKKASFELNYTDPGTYPESEQAGIKRLNASHFSIPDTAAKVGTVYFQLAGMKKKDSLFHLVTKDYAEVNMWVQLKSGDNVDMEAVVADVDAFLTTHPPPVDLTHEWAGLTYLNVEWQDKMVRGMFTSLISSFVVVLIMMMVLFRSPLFGVLSMIPLSVTILFIYGVIGLVGKDYDMPVAVLSALTLGLSVDFAIHFLERAREEQKRAGSWEGASREMFKEPAMAISRNAITISVGFTPLLVAPLVPYRTVGFFLATIMAVSWLATLFILPALLTMLQKRAFRSNKEGKQGDAP